MQIIVGLGNPGEQYKNTRHSAGFMAVDALALKLGLKWETNKKFKAETADSFGLILIKPQTFMNNSGFSAAAVLSYYKLWPKKLGRLKTANADLSKILTIIHDDLDIEFGKYKISVDSRSAGHKGVASIINQLKTKNFRRLRIGLKPARRIGGTSGLKKIPTDKFVLQKFNNEEKNIINRLLAKIVAEIIDKSNIKIAPNMLLA